MMFSPVLHVRHAPLVHVTAGPNGLRATGTTDGSVTLGELYDEVCRRLRDRAPYPIGPIHVAELGPHRVVVDARRARHPFGS